MERAASCAMNKGLTIAGGVCSIIGILTLVISAWYLGDYISNPTENILHNTETDGASFEYDGDNYIIGVYAIGDHGCSKIDVSITDDAYDYFERDCDDTYNTPKYTFLGRAEIDASGTYIIESPEEIILTSQDSVAGGGLAIIAGGGCCFVGLILLIVGMMIGKKNASTGNIIVFQDPMAQQQAQIGMAPQQPVAQYQQPVQQLVVQQPGQGVVSPPPQLSAHQTPHPPSGILANSGVSDGKEWLKHDEQIYYREIGSSVEWTKYQG